MTGSAPDRGTAPGRLDGKVVLVVGATSGIGSAIARRLAVQGATVLAAGRRTELGEQLAADIVADGGTASFRTCDATVEADVAATVQTAIDRYGRLDGAVNNAGGVSTMGPLDRLTAEEWRAELDLNLTSVFHGLKHQLPVIAASGGGAIVTNASTAGIKAVGGLGAYTAAKHGVVGLSRSAALEWADRGVRVNTLVTGNVDTPLYRRLLGAPPDRPTDELAAPNPTGRVATADEIAGLVAYLLGDDAAFVTGAALPIDGGATAG